MRSLPDVLGPGLVVHVHVFVSDLVLVPLLRTIVVCFCAVKRGVFSVLGWPALLRVGELQINSIQCVRHRPAVQLHHVCVWTVVVGWRALV